MPFVNKVCKSPFFNFCVFSTHSCVVSINASTLDRIDAIFCCSRICSVVNTNIIFAISVFNHGHSY